jgi:ssDNA-binding Zn-finger/Zn-ribbon topoisomerase 1
MPECGSQLVKKHGQYGEFIGCTAYPKCKFIRSKTLGIKCPKCETGELTERVARKGRGAFSTGATNIPNAISRRRTCRSPSRARNAARPSSSRSAASWER